MKQWQMLVVRMYIFLPKCRYNGDKLRTETEERPNVILEVMSRELKSTRSFGKTIY